MGDTRQRGETRRGQRGFVDRRVWILLEPAEEPAGGDPRVTSSVFAGDEDRELERVGEAELRQVFRCGHSHEHVAALQRPLECRVRMAGRARSSSSLGAATAQQAYGLFP